MARYVPAAVTEGEKQGFSAPDAELVPRRKHRLRAPHPMDNDAANLRLSRSGASAALVAEHLEGSANRRLLIWSLLSLEHWYKTFLSDATQ